MRLMVSKDVNNSVSYTEVSNDDPVTIIDELIDTVSYELMYKIYGEHWEDTTDED